MKRAAPAFTLIEILAASLAAAILLTAIYGIFQRAAKTRDAATERIAMARQRERAVSILRTDIGNAYLSGGVMACTLEGGLQNQKSHFPGYLRFTTTTGKDTNDAACGDVQQIEYYISDNASSEASSQNGPLVRAVTRNLLATQQESPAEEPLLTRVEHLEFAFYDGQNWQESWQVSGTTAYPQAIRIRLQQTAATSLAVTPPPLEILVPLTSDPFTSSTSSTTGT